MLVLMVDKQHIDHLCKQKFISMSTQTIASYPKHLNWKKLPCIDQVDNINVRDFKNEYGIKSRPLLIKKITNNWQAMSRWTFDFFREEFGDTVQTASRKIEGRKETKEVTLSEYIDYVQHGQDSHPYYLNNCKFHLGTYLEDHYSASGHFDCWLKQTGKASGKNALSWIFIAAVNTTSALHLDIWNTSAWNAVVSGKKLWLFFPRDQETYLYGGRVNPFDPDYEKFPEYRKATPYICIQRPGEIVFTPSNWWHAVLNIEAGISITENFVNETNYKEVKQVLA